MRFALFAFSMAVSSTSASILGRQSIPSEYLIAPGICVILRIGMFSQTVPLLV